MAYAGQAGSEVMTRTITAVFLFFLAISAYGETVSVKYRGLVDLTTFECAATQSSFVHRVCYDRERAYLVLLLNDTYYDYCGVPIEVHSAFLGSASKGRYFNSYI